MAQGKGGRQNRTGYKREKPEFDQQVVDLSRVTRVTKGGKQLSFRACVVIGDRNGRVGFGIDKGKDVQIAVEKAVNQAKKSLIRVPMYNETIPHRVENKYKAARLVLQPAPKGSGVIAGSSIRVVLELAGVHNVSAKMLGHTSNKINNVKATYECLKKFLPRAVKFMAPKLVSAPIVAVPDATVKVEIPEAIKKQEEKIIEEKLEVKKVKRAIKAADKQI